MGKFNPEMSNNRFDVDFELTDRAGDPYSFGLRFDVDGQLFAYGGLSMGDMVFINRRIAAAIREARHAKRS